GALRPAVGRRAHANGARAAQRAGVRQEECGGIHRAGKRGAFGERQGVKNMLDLKYTTSKGLSLLSIAVFVLCETTGVVQSATENCRPTPVIPLTSEEPPAKILIDPPLAEPLASRGVAIIQYCAQNLHLLPVFGPNALTVSPRVGHIHVKVDD